MTFSVGDYVDAYLEIGESETPEWVTGYRLVSYHYKERVYEYWTAEHIATGQTIGLAPYLFRYSHNPQTD